MILDVLHKRGRCRHSDTVVSRAENVGHSVEIQKPKHLIQVIDAYVDQRAAAGLGLVDEPGAGVWIVADGTSAKAIATGSYVIHIAQFARPN